MSISIKQFLPRSLLGRSLLILVTPILLIQIITTYIFFDRHWNRMSGRIAFAVAGEIAVIADYIEQGPGDQPIPFGAVSAYAAQHLDFLVSYEEGAHIAPQPQELRLGANIAQQAKQTVLYDFLAQALEKQVRRPYQISIDMDEKWIEVSLQLNDGVLRVSLPQRRMFSSSGYIFLIWMFGVSMLLLVVAVLFMRNQVRPIRRLAIAAERMGKGRNIPPSFKPEGAREVRQAAQAFLDMQERIRRQVSQRTAMLAGVSHDLRTPLTRMKLQLAMMGNSPDVDGMKSDIAHMERMIGAYLDFARGEGGEVSERIDLAELVERVADNARRAGVTIEHKNQGDLFVFLKPVAFERCLGNVVSNAGKYGHHVWLTASRQDDRIRVVVDDDGPGIPAEKREEVFRPFFRLDESRNPDMGGVGLGLPIAQDIVHAHGGEIELSDSPHGGLRVTIDVPV
ncbi:MAG: HAMP domain-containing protein [Rhodospirillales bacterium]|nr:HAMP domain-containing protein [Rhodospirillales bacterium]